jgi:hypothetical protein
MKLEIYARQDGAIVADRPIPTRPGRGEVVGMFNGSYPRTMADRIEAWLPHAHIEIESVKVSERGPRI